MAGRNTHSSTANNNNPPKETVDEVTLQLNATLPNLLTQLIQAFRGNRANQREATLNCSIKTFKASGAKEFFGTECAVGLLTWFESTASMLHINKCPAESQVEFAAKYCHDDEIQKLESKFWNHKMVGSDIDGYTARFHELARLVPHMGAVSMANRLTTDGIKDGLFKKKENDGNKRRSRATGSLYSILHAGNERPRPTCFECGDPNHFRRNCPRMNRATTSGRNRLNPMLAIEGNTNQGNNRNRAHGRAFGLGVAEAPQDPNVVTGTFFLNDHFATVLFDSGVDYSFISTNFLPLINMKPSVISLGYEIEIASGVKVETNKIIQVGMDWLSKLRAKIVCYEKIVQISLSNRDILEVHRESPEGNLKQLKTMKVNEPKLEDIPVVREFLGVFPEDLLGLPPSYEVEFCIDLITGAMHSKEEHEVYLKLILELLEKEKLFGKFSKCEFWLQEVHFLGHVVNSEGKANVVADALSRKEQLKLRRARAMSMKIYSSIKARILEAQSEASKDVNDLTEMLKGLDKQLERKEDGGLYLAERIWVPVYGNLRTLIINEAHATRYSIHPGANKMYYDLRGLYWWPGMKKDIAILKAAQDRQKSYADNRRKPLEFSVGDKVLLKVSPRKGQEAEKEANSYCKSSLEFPTRTRIYLGTRRRDEAQVSATIRELWLRTRK
ncbi:putative reverse transcriptase domain-containing protein [Tanacetum coccineum]